MCQAQRSPAAQKLTRLGMLVCAGASPGNASSCLKINCLGCCAPCHLDLSALASIALPTLASCLLTLGNHLQGLAAGEGLRAAFQGLRWTLSCRVTFGEMSCGKREEACVACHAASEKGWLCEATEAPPGWQQPKEKAAKACHVQTAKNNVLSKLGSGIRLDTPSSRQAMPGLNQAHSSAIVCSAFALGQKAVQAVVPEAC